MACDLDNTLIHSYKHRQETDICVEWIKGKEQGFMTPKTVEGLRRLRERAWVVPVTARSLDQYRRIRWPEGCLPDYGVTANGGILLARGEVDAEWREESRKAAAPFGEELSRLCHVLAGQSRYIRVRMVDGIYLFACAKEGVLEEKGGPEEETSLTLVRSGRKYYFLPPKIHKGAALRRLRQRLGADYMICAGDSQPDVSMLREADLAIVPSAELAGMVAGENMAVCGPGQNFAEFVLETAMGAVRERRRLDGPLSIHEIYHDAGEGRVEGGPL